MAKQTINIGTTPNDGTGDALRNAFDKTNSNFTELYDGKQDDLVSGTNIKTVNGNSLLGSGDLVVGGSSGITVGTTSVTSGTVGRVFFEGSGNVVQQSASLFWDNTNARLGVGATPASTVRLDVRAQGALSTDIAFRVRNSADNADILTINGNETTIIGRNQSSEPRLLINRAGTTKMILAGNNDLNIIFPLSGYGQINSGAQGLDIAATTSQIRLRTSLASWILNQGTVQYTSTIRSTGTATRSYLTENGVSPSIDFTDSHYYYSADITAGNAAPHFRTENGSVVKLYQQTSTGTETVADVVQYLKNLGLLV
jgi:hypothetical protein